MYMETRSEIMLCYHIVCILSTAWILSSAAADLPDCSSSDYRPEYTVCDSENHRWSVYVPDRTTCQPTSASYTGFVPRLSDCLKECDSGQFLDIDTQECRDCPAGTHATGRTVRFEEWDTLPKGFSVTTEGFMGRGGNPDQNCTAYEFQPHGSYISAKPGACSTHLVYTVTLVKPGALEFDYQFPTQGGALFYVTVQNDRCQAANDRDSSKWPGSTDQGTWGHIKMELKSGFNVIKWIAIGLEDEAKNAQVSLRKISVRGVEVSSTCARCEAGTYSSQGASFCTSCPMNTFSGKGAGACQPCLQGKEYSVPGSTNCTRSPSCTTEDYYEILEPCTDGKTKRSYQWIEPRICYPDWPDSVNLPQSTSLIDCHPCNPGMHLVNGTCEYCPKDYKSDGDQCVKCNVSTAPDYGYVYENWNTIPDDFRTSCISFHDANCSIETRWLPFGSHIITHYARGESAYLVLQKTVSGFRTQGAETGTTVGQFILTFETSCDYLCQFLLLTDEDRGDQEIKHMWEDSVNKTKFVYDVKKNKSVTFTLAFRNTGMIMDATAVKNSSAKIYKIEITNTIEGGAKSCQKCPKGSNKAGCIPCPSGSYIDASTTSCANCPTGTVVKTNNAYGAESCKVCGKGLKTYKGRACFSDGLYTPPSGRNYDFSNLSEPTFVQGSVLFTASGAQYFHGFNISLFGDPESANVVCRNNISVGEDMAMKEPKELVAKICRSTLIPASEKTGDIMSTQSASLGDVMLEIVQNETQLEGHDINLSQLYAKSGFELADFQNDIQFHFAAETPTRACPGGRHTVVSLRCDKDEMGKGEVVLPPKCADGTCDGCTFHFLWKTRSACPLCTKDDFKRIVSECVSGYQTIHYFAPPNCIVMNEGLLAEETRTCTMRLTALPLAFQIAIPVVVGLAFILFFMLCFFWRKNKKLEYKYMKLVENSGNNDAELPVADSCGLEEDEEEGGDAVQIKDSKGARFFKKLTNKIRKPDDAFESTIMNDRMPLT